MIFSLVLGLLSLNIAVAQGSNDLVFESCSQNEDPKSCSLLLLGQLLQDQLNLSGFPSQFKEQDVITLSLKLYFNNEGLLKPDWSIIYDPKTASHEVFESVLKNIPKASSYVDIFNKSSLSVFEGYFSFKQNNSRFQLAEISNEGSEELKIPMRVPVYPGCKSKWDNERLMKCFRMKLNTLSSKTFDKRKVESTAFQKGQNIQVTGSFIIDGQGKVVISKINTKDPSLASEVARVLKKIPDMEAPGYLGSKAISIPYSLPFVIQF